MKNYIILGLTLLTVNVCLGQITFFACPGSFTSSPNEYNFTLEGTDSTGRNYYQTNPIDGAQSCAAGICEFRIAWSVANNRWEVLLFQNQVDFSDAIVVYHNSNTASPNPPSLNLGTWMDTTAACGGALTSSNSTFTGDVQDTTLGNENAFVLDKQIQVFPNPVSKTIFITSQGVSVKEVLVYSILGNVLINQSATNQVDVSNLSKGIYMVKVLTTSNESLLRRIVVN